MKKTMLGTMAILVVVLVIAASGSREPPRAPPPPVATAAEKLEVARQAAEEEATRQARYTLDRPGVIARAKAFVAARKYREAADLGNSYMWAHDTELDAVVDPARDKLVAAEMAKSRAERKKQGVRIGMSKDDVLASSWGKPQHVNKTTTARGTSEQWVYPGYHSYLYFTGETLTSIQN